MEIDSALDNYSMEHGGKYPGLKRHHIDPGGGIIRMGPAIIGGNGGPVNQPNILNQDDYLEDMKIPDSPYRAVPGQTPIGPPRQRLKAVDELYREGLYRYIDNPLADKGTAMVNVAYIEYDYNPTSNEGFLVNDILGSPYDELAIGYPDPGGFYTSIPPWDPNDPTTYDNYPAGNFAYIPMSFTREDGKYARGYWIIGYGDQKTLRSSPYNKLLDDPNWPNLKFPFGDGDPSTPPDPDSFEDTVRRLITGALVVRANVYEDQLTGRR
jgi:hypothetical protein